MATFKITPELLAAVKADSEDTFSVKLVEFINSASASIGELAALKVSVASFTTAQADAKTASASTAEKLETKISAMEKTIPTEASIRTISAEVATLTLGGVGGKPINSDAKADLNPSKPEPKTWTEKAQAALEQNKTK